jgi:glyoxylase I family protein
MTDMFSKFLETHKDVSPAMLPSLLGTYSTCQSQQLRGLPADLTDAYRHVLGSCERCRNTYARKAEALGVPLQERLFTGINHVAIIASNYERSKNFYVNKLGFAVVDEQKRPADGSPILYLNAGNALIELFFFPNAPERNSGPEAKGLRHLSLETIHFDKTLESLCKLGIKTEPPRVDARNNMRYTFFKDPDGLPLEVTERIETEMEKGFREYAELRAKYPRPERKVPEPSPNQMSDAEFDLSMINILRANAKVAKHKKKTE